MGRLASKVAIVTGGGSGIGKAVVITLAREGADVVVADIDLPLAQNVAAEIESMGRQSRAITVDVTSSQQVNQMVRDTLDAFKKIDILVNNAGITKLAPPEEESEAQWDETININLKGQFLCSQAVGREMIKQKRGKIINIASIAGHRGVATSAAYGASKAGVLSLTKTLAVNWAKHNINVNSVSPGTTITPIVEKVAKSGTMDPEEFFKEMTKYTPLRRANKPEDIANAVLFLASPESDNMTGQDIAIDGGSLAVYPNHLGLLLK